MRDFLVKIALRLGIYNFAVEKLTKAIERKSRKAFHKHGLATLVKADKACCSVGTQMFLNFGTLLGAYRNHDFIPYDCDLDVGMMADKRPADFEKVMQQHGFALKKEFYDKNTGEITEDQFESDGVQIDFFYYFADGDDVYCHVAHRHETKEWKEANRTDGFPCVIRPCTNDEMERRTFLGHEFYMPKDTDRWLKSLYGNDYMTPIKGWQDTTPDIRIIHTGKRLYRRYL